MAPIRELQTTGIGPAPSFDVQFADRLNVLTGDNGLGKTLFLDLIWWGLTQSWASQAALPSRGETATIKITLGPITESITTSENEIASAEFNVEHQRWITERKPVQTRGIAVYARTDGSMCVWDCYRNRAPEMEGLQAQFWGRHSDSRTPFFKLDENQLWNGSSSDRPWCNGLLRDWVNWQFDQRPVKQSAFNILASLVTALFPKGETPSILPPKRLSIEDSRDVPMLGFSYGPAPLIVLSAAMKRILELAYVLVWAWQEHIEAAATLGKPASKEMVLLFDEVELHLHPRWQRYILPAVMKVAQKLDPDIRFQAVVSTHSPLVLSSIETHVNPDKDKLWHFFIDNRLVKLEELDLRKRGNVVDWLDDVFGVQYPMSIEAQSAIEEAEAMMLRRTKGSAISPVELEEIESELKRTLPGNHEFWIRWLPSKDRP